MRGVQQGFYFFAPRGNLACANGRLATFAQAILPKPMPRPKNTPQVHTKMTLAQSPSAWLVIYGGDSATGLKIKNQSLKAVTAQAHRFEFARPSRRAGLWNQFQLSQSSVRDRWTSPAFIVGGLGSDHYFLSF
jgi:hypothetical protein